MHRMRYYRSIHTNRTTINLKNPVRRQTNVALNTHRAALRKNVTIVTHCRPIRCYWIDARCVAILQDTEIQK